MDQDVIAFPRIGQWQLGLEIEKPALLLALLIHPGNGHDGPRLG
jgi:hypothetical protein